MTTHLARHGTPARMISLYLKPPPGPGPQQVPAPYAIIMMRGLQTRFYRTLADFRTHWQFVRGRGQSELCLCFRYSDPVGHYHVFNPETDIS